MVDWGRGAGIPFVGAIRRRPLVALIVAGLLVGVGIVMLEDAISVDVFNTTDDEATREALRTMRLASFPVGVAGLILAPLNKTAGALLLVAVPIGIISDTSSPNAFFPLFLILVAIVWVAVAMLWRRFRPNEKFWSD